MGLGVDLISKAATAVGTKIVKKAATGVAVTAAGTAVTGIEKAQGLAALAGKKINSRKGMLTKEEFYDNNPNAYLLTIPDMEIDTRTIYNKSESSGQPKKQFSVYFGNGQLRCNVRIQKKLNTLKYLITASNGQTVTQIGTITRNNKEANRVNVSVYNQFLTNISKDGFPNANAYICTNTDWLITNAEEPYTLQICFKNYVVAKIIKVMADKKSRSKNYEHILQLIDNRFELQGLFFLLAVSILENTHEYDVPDENSSLLDIVF